MPSEVILSDALDAALHLRHKALYVEPLKQPIDWSKMPADGNEFIHRVRIEAESALPHVDWGFCPGIVKELKAKSIAEGKHLLLPHWKKEEASTFFSLSSKLATERKRLMRKFPQKLPFPGVENEKDVCLFLLGSKLFNKIFSSENVEETNGHSPLLSIVLHVEQSDILIILKYLRKWSNLIEEMNDDICVWIYAFLACLQKPFSKECEVFLEELYDECVLKNKDCEEKNQFHLLDSILYNSFYVKNYKMGDLLLKYSKLRYCR